MSDNQLEKAIDRAWEERESISTSTKGELRESVEEALNLMDSGAERVASPIGEHKWHSNDRLIHQLTLLLR